MMTGFCTCVTFLRNNSQRARITDALTTTEARLSEYPHCCRPSPAPVYNCRLPIRLCLKAADSFYSLHSVHVTSALLIATNDFKYWSQSKFINVRHCRTFSSSPCDGKLSGTLHLCTSARQSTSAFHCALHTFLHTVYMMYCTNTSQLDNARSRCHWQCLS